MITHKHTKAKTAAKVRNGATSKSTSRHAVKARLSPAIGKKPAKPKPADSLLQTNWKAAADGVGDGMPVIASGLACHSADHGHMAAPRRTRHSFTARRTRPRLLWIGDALVPTGFATVTHAVLSHLQHEWQIVVSGVNYDGRAHELPYRVMPAQQGGDMWGMNRFQDLCAEFDPTAVIINNDWWNVAQFARLAPAGVPVIGYMPVDGGHLDPAAMAEINRLHTAVWYTHFGHRAACAAGFTGRYQIIPHGIDTDFFQPGDRAAARQALRLDVPPGAFIVGNINRNQPRKRLDLTIQIFAAWIRQHGITNARLLLHCAEKDTGWDLRRVAACYGVADRLILTGAENIRDLQDVHRLRSIYHCLDVQMTTTLGEGWGLTTMEGMACGIPQIVPRSSALEEWAAPAVKIPCSRTLIHPEINTAGALVDEAPFVAALQSLYQSRATRTRLAAQGVAHVRSEAFRWENVAGQFHTLLAATPRMTERRQASRRRLLSSRA